MRALAVMLASLLVTSAARAEPAARGVSIAEVRSRIDAMDPALRAKAFERVGAEVDLRRAEWSRVSGSLGVVASDTYSYVGFGAVGASMGDPVTSNTISGSLQGQIRVPLWAGGALDRAIDAAEARAIAAKFDQEQLRRELTVVALTAYANVVAATEQQTIARRAFERAESLVEIAETRVGSGIAARSDVATAQLNRLRQAEDFESRVGERAESMAALRASLLEFDGGELRPTDSLSALSMLAATQVDGRPELRVADFQVKALEGDRDVAAASYLPRLELFASGTYGGGRSFGPPIAAVAASTDSSSTDTSPMTSTGQGGWSLAGAASAGAQLTWTGWDFGVTRDHVARAAANVARARADLDDLRRKFAKELLEARARENASRRRSEVLRGGETLARDAVDLARARYQSGTAILTEVLEAELQATGVESRQVKANYDLAVAHIERLRAEGARP